MNRNTLIPIYYPGTKWQVVVPYDVAQRLDRYEFVEPMWRFQTSPVNQSLSTARMVNNYISYGSLLLRPTIAPAQSVIEPIKIQPPPYQSKIGQQRLEAMIDFPYTTALHMGGYFDVLSKHPQLIEMYPPLGREENQHLTGQIFGRAILENPSETDKAYECLMPNGDHRNTVKVQPEDSSYSIPKLEKIVHHGTRLTREIVARLGDMAKGVYPKTSNHVRGLILRGGPGAGFLEVMIYNDSYLLGLKRV